jgi:hypothetical protein
VVDGFGMSRTWVLCTLVACAAAAPVVAGHVDPARGADTPAAKDKADNPNKGPGSNSGKGRDDSGKEQDAPAPAAPAVPDTPTPPAAPADPGKGKDNGKADDKGKGPKNAPTTATPGPTAPPPAAAGPVAAPGASAAPVVAFDTPATAPAVGRSVGVAAAQGTVYVRTADGRPLHALDAAAAIPTGARVDARAGTVELTSVVSADGTAQTASFTGAIFEVRQDKATGLTRIRLRGGDFSGCRGVRRAAAATKKRKPIRSLWGKDDHGRFQTRGKGAVGTVRGTRWLTEDFCDGTRTTVAEGKVAVRDLRTGKTHVVRAGHSYFAKY